MAAAAALIAVAPAAAQSQATITPAAETRLGLVIWGVIELTDDNETVSPD